MDSAGVDRSFLISYDAEDTRWSAKQHGYEMEDYAGGKKHTLRNFEQFPDRFYWFSTLKDPAVHSTIEILREDHLRGATGFKLFPAYVGAQLDDNVWTSIAESLAEVHAPLLISFETLRPTVTFGLAEYVAQLDILLSRVPELRVALLHAGCADPLTEDGQFIAELCERHDGIYLSTAMPGEVWDDDIEYPFENLRRRIERLSETVGAQRLMWATDWPWFEDRFNYRQGIECFRRHADFFDDAALDGFLGGNAERFLAGG
jgi:predicted TIM-barrel fold metal-dependent hydrolase